MKQDFDKEIDSLLRRTAANSATGGRREESRAANVSESAHLDADELSAYAENALPAPARLRYVAHLADCDSCRSIVVDLSGAAGMAAELDKRASPAAPESLKVSDARSWLASLFAPRVLRYVVPVLALTLLGAIAFVALRSQRSTSDVANVGNTSEGGRADVRQETDAGAAANEAVQPQNPNQAAPTVGTNNNAPDLVASASATPERKTAGEAMKEVAGPQPVTEVAEVGSTAVAQPEAPSPASAAAGAAATAAEAKPSEREAQPPASRDEERFKASQEEANTRYTGNQAAENRALNQLGRQRNIDSPDGSRGDKRQAGNDSVLRGGIAATSPAPPPPPASTSVPRPSARRRSSTDSQVKKEDADSSAAEPTRSAAGHRFRRQGDAWIDVNYRSSMSMTGVRRGTEEFRALVADLPELGRIAGQLGGEVIAVINGRAYRIR
ncbi:MAG TPA: zf-HC2 domain-containing protein [Pyrinomonadaceae bacterium]|jgi:hypothetical protein|nr:zf-HC2 domain-containing protein [Pyrinomonadaceae bacterium]